MRKLSYEFVEQILAKIRELEPKNRTARQIAIGMLNQPESEANFLDYNRKLGIVNYYLKRMIVEKIVTRKKDKNAFLYSITEDAAQQYPEP